MKRKIDPSSPCTRKNRQISSSKPLPSDDRFSPIPIGITTGVLAGAGGQTQTLLFGPQQPQTLYTEDFGELEEEEAPKFKYGYTDSELFCFITSLTPIEYLVFTGVIVTVFYIKLNTLEQQVFASLLIDLGVTLANLVEQEAFQKARETEAKNREERNMFIRRQKELEKKVLEIMTELDLLTQAACSNTLSELCEQYKKQ